MTCVVGLAHEGKVTIGADSAATCGWDIITRADPKVALIGNQCVIGFAGNFRAWQAVRFTFNPPEHKRGPLDKYMSTTFVDSLRRCLSEAGIAEKKDNVEDSPSDFIVGIKGRIFVISGDYDVQESTYPFDAVGAGGQIALAAMIARKDGSPKARLQTALRTAAALNNTVRPPWRFETR